MEKLSTYPRPNVAVDVAVLSVSPSTDPKRTPGQLVVLVERRADPPRGTALPGRFLREGETVADCARIALREKAGIDIGAAPRLLRVFDAPGRDPRAWTISLAHSLVLPPAYVEHAVGELVPVDLDGRLARRRLLFDHAEIVREAAAAIRERYELTPDPDGLLDGPFTLADLRNVHDAVLGARVRRDTFRRRMEPALVPHLERDGRPATRVDGGRPARLWTVDRQRLETPERLRLPRD